MNEETKLKLQAHLDGELSGSDMREISRLLSGDNDARLLAEELQFVKKALPGNELEIKLPESREFYWSKIASEIERAEKQPVRAPALSWWRPVFARYIGGFAAACALLMISFIAFNNQSVVLGELEGGGEDMGAITYHSDTDRMTVVYLFDRHQHNSVDSDDFN